MSYGMGPGPFEMPREDSWTSQPRGGENARSSHRDAASGARGRERPCILFIDDEPHDREIYGRILCYNGFDVAFARTGEEALRLAANQVMAAIVLDLGLPDIPGLQLLQRLREQPSWRTVPVIVLSAFGHDQVADRVKRMGCARYMEKPARPVDVFLAVETLVGRPPQAGVGRLPRIIDGPDDVNDSGSSHQSRSSHRPAAKPNAAAASTDSTGSTATASRRVKPRQPVSLHPPRMVAGSSADGESTLSSAGGSSERVNPRTRCSNQSQAAGATASITARERAQPK